MSKHHEFLYVTRICWPNLRVIKLVLSRFKSKEVDFVGFITKIHVSRFVIPIFMFFKTKNSQHSVSLENITICFSQKLLFLLILVV